MVLDKLLLFIWSRYIMPSIKSYDTLVLKKNLQLFKILKFILSSELSQFSFKWSTIFTTVALVIKSWQYNHYTWHVGNATTMFRIMYVFVIPTFDGYITAYRHSSWVNIYQSTVHTVNIHCRRKTIFKK